MSNILSVSIKDEQAIFINEMNLSPSALLQSKIDECIESYKVTKQELEKQSRKIAFLQETINKQRNFIESKNLMLDFLKC